jgi:sugar phosphate isomerase/epimerase
MLPGLSSQIFYPHRLTPAHLDALAASGARVLELFAARFHFDYTDRQLLRETSAWFRSNDLKPTLHAPITADPIFSRHSTPNLNLVAQEKPRRIEAMEEIKRALESAETIPFATCVLHLGVDGDSWSDYALEYALTAIEHLKAFAGPLGVRLLLENLRNDVATPTHLLEVLRIGHFDTLGLCLDIGHAHLAASDTGQTIAQTVEALRPKIAELHLHDNHGATGGPNPGKPDEHLWPASGTERPSTLAIGSTNWHEVFSHQQRLLEEQ